MTGTTMIGKTLGHYKILEQLGRGGMGEVYLADDTTLDRKVALKFLPEAFTSDPERMARFEREAKLLASLNHSSIAGIYGLEQTDGNRYLVLEYVEGETLQAKLSKGALPLEDALAMCRQMAEGLEAAHEKGVIHRDLKPANVMITAEEKVKILDFGLAKALSDDTKSIDSSQSPTLTEAMTQPGVILGTAAYMSPEQAKGRSVDKRADIWAFGCILYECLTGKRVFEGETVTETLAAVIRAEANWDALPAATPKNIRFVLRRCLEKERGRRLRDAADLQILLDEQHDIDDVTLPVKVKRSWFWKSVAAFFVLAFCIMAFLYFTKKPPITNDLIRFKINLPTNVSLAPTRSLALSPDGKFLAFAALGPNRDSGVWLHEFDLNEARRLPGAESGWITSLFWSPDSRFIGFNVEGKLKKIDINTGHTSLICEASTIPRGGSWNKKGIIIYGGMNAEGISQVSAEGGTPSSVTNPDPEKHEKTHRYPVFLPDGRHFLYFCDSELPGESGIYVGSIDLKPQEQNSQRVLATDYSAIYVPSEDSDSGHLLYLDNQRLWAQAFDEKQFKRIDDPIPLPLSEQVTAWARNGLFSASLNGLLVYGNFFYQKAQLTWFDRQGTILDTIEGAAYGTLGMGISPDGSQAAVSWTQDKSAEIQLIDFTSGENTTITFGGNINGDPTWTPDGSEIIYASDRNGVFDIYKKSASSIKNEILILESDEFKIPTSMSSDGEFLLYRAQNKKGNHDLLILPLENEAAPYYFANTDSNEGSGKFSFNMRWIAYTSDETGSNEVYVQSFSPASPGSSKETEDIWRISEGGGNTPLWNRDGDELYYRTPDGTVMVVDVAEGDVFRKEKPKPLFQIPLLTSRDGDWDVAPDGDRFLIATDAIQTSSSPFNVMLNWTSLLEKK